MGFGQNDIVLVLSWRELLNFAQNKRPSSQLNIVYFPLILIQMPLFLAGFPHHSFFAFLVVDD